MTTAKFTITIKLCISIIVFLMPSFLIAQNILISQGGTVNVEGGEMFYDAGGNTGNDGNTSFTVTLMPPSGKSVCVDFTSFSSFEILDIFDGTSVSSTNIGSLKGNYSLVYNASGSPYNTGQPALGGVVQAELKPGIFCANNATGALTFRFTNLSASQSTGWEGLVTVFNNSVSGCTIDLAADKTTICPSQSVTLTATGTIGASALDNTFNTGVIGTGWNATPGGVAFLSVLSCQPNNGYNTNKPDNSIFAWMQNVAAPRILESNAFDVSNGGVISFDFRAASDDDGGNGCEANDDKEGIYVQYSTDNGLSWVNMKLMFPSVESNFNASANIGAGTYVYNWNKTTLPIPIAAQTTNTKFRWYQHQSTTGSQDSWGIDDVKIIRNKPVTLTITDLSTNTVIATTTSATISTIVSPTVTTNFRAIITDGVSSCFEDITINVTTGSTTSIAYPLTTISNTNTTIQTINVTNGPVTGNYSASPSGLTINSTTGAVTPNTSLPGTYTISVPTSCGVATTSITITNSTCSTCANATCPVVSIQTTTAALGQTGITTALNTAGDQLATPTLLPGQNITICVPVTVPVGTTVLGFKQLTTLNTFGCASPSGEVITYQLKPANNCSGSAIVPTRTNASSVTSGFNPEWDGLASGNYILCFTLNVTSLTLCTTVDLQGLGYYTVIPSITCQDYQIQMYDDDTISTIHSGTTFACSDTGVYLGPVSLPSVFDGGLPFPALKITITATSGNLNNLVLNRYDAGNNTLAEVLTVPASGISNNYFLRPSPGQYYKIDKTNTASGTYNYTVIDIVSGLNVASGTWTIVSGSESAASTVIFPQGTATYSGPGVSNGFDPNGIDNYTNDRGIGFFNPSTAGVGTHTITYTWNNGLATPNNCTLTRTKTVTVTGPSAPTLSNISICSGTTAIVTAGGITTGAIVKWYDALTGGNLLFTGNSFTTPPLTSSTSYWVSQTIGSCESNRTRIDVIINPTIIPTFTQVAAICSGATLTALPTTSNNGITGSWLPALNNTTTTTYTFTPDSGQCATTATMTITVNPNVTPTFTQVAAICSGATLTALPTTSNNGITGSWSPALNNTTTTTYTFTPDSGQCATTVTMTITVNPNVTPTFTQVAAICSGATLTALPTTSNNGITGSWSPALNNTTTTTYTFTPYSGQCATTATMTITVNPNVTPTFTQVAAICSGATLTALPTTSNNGITGSWSPALNNTTTTTYTFTPATGQCATTATMTITVNPNVTPTFTQVAAICSGATLTALPTTSNNGITGSWLPALNNTTTTTYTFTPDLGQCATMATMTITVNPNVTPTFTQVAAICSGATLSALPTTSNNGITGSWSPALNNTTTTTYTFTPTTGQCATTATMTITVNPNITPTFTQVAAICSGATLTALPTTSSNGITGSWLPALNNTTTTTYTFTPDSGQCATSVTMTIIVNPNVTPTFTQVAAICSGATLTALPTTSNNSITGSWSPALNNTTTTTYTFTPDSGQCATTATMTITVNPNVTPTFTQVAAICSGATLSALPTTSNNSITGSWSPVLNNTTTTTYTFTPDSGQCATTATMTITVNNSPQITFSGNLSYCNGATSSILLSSNQPNTTFTWNVVSSNLSTGTSFIVSGTGSTISQQLALLNNLNQGFVTYLVTPSVNGCIGNSVEIPLTVNPIPTFTITAAQNPICSGEMVNISFTSTIAATQYSWTVTSQVGVTGALSGSGQSINQTLLATSPITSGTVTYLITPSLNGCIGIPKSITITVNPRPEIIGTLIPQSICSGESTNITVAASIVGTQFSFQVIDANHVTGYSNGTGGVIQQILTTVGDLQGYVIYEVTPSLNGCIGIPKQYKVFVNPLPKPVLINGPICVSTSGIPFGTYELNTGLNTIDYQFSWFLNGNLIVGSGASLVATQPGNYLVKVKNIHTNCQGQATALVFPITPANSMSVTVSEAFSDNPTITVNVIALGNGNLMYQLDGGAYQESNIFYNVEEGMHEIHVVDQEGCTDLYQNVRVINYPKFFTPNGDGYNDTWNINGFQSGDNAVLYIFDRYGKLIKQLFAPGIGWDGTYLGQQLPSTDYWFTVEYTEKQQRKLFKSHFSLKR